MTNSEIMEQLDDIKKDSVFLDLWESVIKERVLINSSLKDLVATFYLLGLGMPK